MDEWQARLTGADFIVTEPRKGRGGSLGPCFQPTRLLPSVSCCTLTSHLHNFPIKPWFCTKNLNSTEMWNIDNALQYVRGRDFMGGRAKLS